MRLVVLLAVSLLMIGCTNKQIVTETKIVKIIPPVITSCERLTVKECQPTTNGELYECALLISKNLSLCADQTDALINWQQEL